MHVSLSTGSRSGLASPSPQLKSIKVLLLLSRKGELWVHLRLHRLLRLRTKKNTLLRANQRRNHQRSIVPYIQIYSEGNKLYYAIGDRHVLIKNLSDERGDERISIVRQHSNNVCSHSMTMMYGLKEVIFCAFPTQKRESLRRCAII